MRKKEAREEFKKQRAALSVAERLSLSEDICANAFELLQEEHCNIHLFFPIEKLLEVNTFPLADRLWKDPARSIIASKTDFKTLSMDHFDVLSPEDLRLSDWGIPEPTISKPVFSGQLDVVFVPLLVADKTGMRVGYGKGFYDQFLGSVASQTIKVGLSFFPPIGCIEDVHVGDVALDILVTPDAIYRFEKH